MSPSLTEVLTLRTVRELADARTFARGEAYFHGGAVGLLDADDQEVRASVQGTQRYRVCLRVGVEEELEYECDCGRRRRRLLQARGGRRAVLARKCRWRSLPGKRAAIGQTAEETQNARRGDSRVPPNSGRRCASRVGDRSRRS